MSEPPLRVLVVDDEPLARERLRSLLEADPEVEIVGERADGRGAVEAVRELAPDLVFLDVQMPGLTGFEVLAELANEERPAIVFSTAYDEYALAAFDVHAVDYLLKPYDDARFDEALQRAAGALRSERLGDFHERVRALLGQVAHERSRRRRTRRVELRQVPRTIRGPDGGTGHRRRGRDRGLDRGVGGLREPARR